MFFVGVDGCRSGWCTVSIAPDDKWEAQIFQSFAQLWEKYLAALLILVDIPIGLRQGSPDNGNRERQERRCDKEVRKLLGSRRSSVFRVPCRPAIYAADYNAALEQNERLTGTRIFRATWNIAGKIREVDEFLQSNREAGPLVREVHPELGFWSLNGCQPLTYPKTWDRGYLERLRLLQSVYSQAETVVEQTLARYPRREVRRDDIVDALCAAVTAKRGWDNLRTIPRQPERDQADLPMEIVYFLFSLYQGE